MAQRTVDQFDALIAEMRRNDVQITPGYLKTELMDAMAYNRIAIIDKIVGMLNNDSTLSVSDPSDILRDALLRSVDMARRLLSIPQIQNTLTPDKVVELSMSPNILTLLINQPRVKSFHNYQVDILKKLFENEQYDYCNYLIDLPSFFDGINDTQNVLLTELLTRPHFKNYEGAAKLLSKQNFLRVFLENKMDFLGKFGNEITYDGNVVVWFLNNEAIFADFSANPSDSYYLLLHEAVKNKAYIAANKLLSIKSIADRANIDDNAILKMAIECNYPALPAEKKPKFIEFVHNLLKLQNVISPIVADAGNILDLAIAYWCYPVLIELLNIPNVFAVLHTNDNQILKMIVESYTENQKDAYAIAVDKILSAPRVVEIIQNNDNKILKDAIEHKFFYLAKKLLDLPNVRSTINKKELLKNAIEESQNEIINKLSEIPGMFDTLTKDDFDLVKLSVMKHVNYVFDRLVQLPVFADLLASENNKLLTDAMLARNINAVQKLITYPQILSTINVNNNYVLSYSALMTADSTGTNMATDKIAVSKDIFNIIFNIPAVYDTCDLNVVLWVINADCDEIIFNKILNNPTVQAEMRTKGAKFVNVVLKQRITTVSSPHLILLLLKNDTIKQIDLSNEKNKNLIKGALEMSEAARKTVDTFAEVRRQISEALNNMLITAGEPSVALWDNVPMAGGGKINYKAKYLKYKQKYTQLKNKIN